jgi:predicted nucleic acid-binding protein
MIVIDASAMLEVLLVTPVGVRILDRIFSTTEESLHAPQLLDLEVAQVLRRYCATGELVPERAQQALADLTDLAVTRYPHPAFLPRIWELRDNITAYDAAYVALAEVLGAPLLTGDVRLAAAPGHDATVELIGDLPTAQG